MGSGIASKVRKKLDRRGQIAAKNTDSRLWKNLVKDWNKFELNIQRREI